MSFDFSIGTTSGQKDFSVQPGESLLFVGANGGGKTRVAVAIESALSERAHRISAHRALNLNPGVAKISERVALTALRTGNPQEQLNIGHRANVRWGSKAAVAMLNDYDFLVQALFADQANVSLESHQNARLKNGVEPKATKLEALVGIWDRILPHRHLTITGDNIEVSVAGAAEKYPAAEMSDGERAIFYLIGQTLSAPSDTLIIFDEPELHIHRSIMSRLWDELEAARPDCGMVFISHDLEFVASRQGQKFVLSKYTPQGGWTIEPVPEDSGFSEETATLILGSRKPILFVEGAGNSLDKAIYRACYPQWTVIPRGSCEQVIHAVVTMRANAALTRVTCAGIVDADDRGQEELASLNNRGIQVLPVSEIENLFLLPPVAEAIGGIEGFAGAALTAHLAPIYGELFAHAGNANNLEPVVLQYCRRRIDRVLKKIDLSAAVNVADLATEYGTQTAALDVEAVAALSRNSITDAINAQDVAELLKWYDNKAIMAIACKVKQMSKTAFEQWIVRSLLNNSAPTLAAAIAGVLPPIVAQ